MLKSWEEGKAETRADDVLTVLRVRGIAVPDAARRRCANNHGATSRPASNLGAPCVRGSRHGAYGFASRPCSVIARSSRTTPWLVRYGCTALLG